MPGRSWLLLLAMILLVGKLQALTATVYMSDASVYHGSIFFNRSLHFRDVFRREAVRVRPEQLYRIDLLIEAVKAFRPWRQKTGRAPTMQRRYLMVITTWEGTTLLGSPKFTSCTQRKAEKAAIYFAKVQVLRHAKVSTSWITCVASFLADRSRRA